MTETETAAPAAPAPTAPIVVPESNPDAPSLIVPSDDGFPDFDAAVAAGLAKIAEQEKIAMSVAEVEQSEAAARAAAAPPAPKPAEAPAKPATEVAPEAEAAPSTTEPEVDPELKARRIRFQQEARIERKRREAEEAFRAKEAALAAKEQEITQWKQSLAAAKGDPVKARQIMERELGITYADETTHYINEGRETAEQKIARLEAKLAEVADATKKIETDRVAREEAARKEYADAQERQQHESVLNSIHAHVSTSPDKYPLLNSGLVENPQSKVLNVMIAIFQEGLNEPGLPQIMPRTRLTLDKAAEIAETFYQGRLRATKLIPAPAAEAAKSNGASAASPKDAAGRSVKASVTAGLSAPGVQNQAPPPSDDYDVDKDAAIARIVSRNR
jgi:hypothetical protein